MTASDIKPPLLSIIVPIYNVEEYLEECINSILIQEFKDYELILVDDGSPDGCGKICDDYAVKDSRIRVIHKTNGGLSSARNAGIDIAQGRYLSFIDSDDFISSDYYLGNMQYLLSHQEVDMLVAQVCYYDGDKNKIAYNKSRELFDEREILNYMLSMEYISSAWINIYKADIFSDLRFPEGRIYEDGYILTDIVKKVKKVYLSNMGIYYYRNRENSIMTKKKSLSNWNDILKTHSKQLDFCYQLNDDKRLFLQKYEVCHLALIYACTEYPESSFKNDIIKFETYHYTLSHLLNSKISIKSVLKLYLLKIAGYKAMIKLYQLLGKN